MDELILLYVPVNDARHALRLARGAVTQQLAVCAQVMPAAQSVYRDKAGETVQDAEHILVVKTLPSHVVALEQWLEAEHPYDTPCIARLTGRVNAAYYAWAVEQLSGK
mgnify:CR=1 FL=1